MAKTKLMKAPADRTKIRSGLGLEASAPGSVGSSSPNMRTKPPSGRAFSEYSVSAELEGGDSRREADTELQHAHAR